MSTVSVVIPCYKYAHYLRGCVRSVLEQPGVDVRALIIDDCSPDNTREVGAALARDDARVNFRRHETNCGHIATYNEGIEWADGDYFLLLSADDLATPGALTRAVAVMDAHPKVCMTHGRFFRLKNESVPEPYESPQTYGVNIVPGMTFFEQICRAGENIVNTPTAIVRTGTQKVIGGYDPALPHAGDMAMWLRFAAHGDVAFIDAMQAHYRFHTTNLHLAFYDRPLRDLEQKRVAFGSVFDSLRSRIADVPRLAQLAHQSLAMEAFWVAGTLLDAGEIAKCDEVISLALDLYPGLVNAGDFKKFQWKRRLGAKLWRTVMPFIRAIRRSQPATA
jgi:hypothetical protein